MNYEKNDTIVTLTFDDVKANAVGHQFLDDINAGLDRAQSEKAGAIILRGREGMFSGGFDLGEFKKGPFHLSLNTGVTIIPIGLMGAYKAKKFSDWRIYPGKINVKVGDPVKSEYYRKMSVEELRDDIRDKISVLCKDDTIAVTNNQ